MMARPAPKYPDVKTRDLTQALGWAYRKRAELEAVGEDLTDANETILDLRRKIREGGRLKAGDRLLDGRFELLEKIGTGGFAEVWKAYDESALRVVALKVLHGQYAEDRTRCERFFRGARQMAKLSHQGVVRVLEEHCEDQPFFFFVMEYVGGGDLRQAVKARRLTEKEIWRIILEIGEVLAHAHKSGVVHRDIKPGNILLGLNGVAKLTDFDLVRAIDTTGGTRTTGMGTFLYAAPEAMMDAKAAGEPADVYGLAMTAVFALHGADLPAGVIWTLPEFVAGLEVGEGVKNVLQQALAREVADRWATAEEFCQALKTQVFPPSPRQHKGGSRLLAELEFVEIEGGEFWMGSPDGEEGRRDNETRHRVRLTQGFGLATTPVTQRQFGEFVEAMEYETRGRGGKTWRDSGGPDHPVVYVAWEDAVAFCRWLSGEWNREIRLPTEAEWEYAARADTEGAIYAPNRAEIAWYSENSDGHAHPVGQKAPNPWGLYDMLGNVWEWVADGYAEYPGKGVTVDPVGPPGPDRVRRGGSWRYHARSVRAASRYWYRPGDRSSNLGFRLSRGQGRGASAVERERRSRG